MSIEEELNKLGIKYQVDMFNNEKVIECNNGVRVHIYPKQITLCEPTSFYSFPIREDSLRYVLEVIKSYEHKGN